MFISLVTPIYKKLGILVNIIRNQLNELDRLAIKHDFDYELIAVVDGNIDSSYKELQSIQHVCLKKYKYNYNRGKGFATRYGFAKANGDYIGYVDCSNHLMIRSVTSMIETLISNPDKDFLIGSKSHENSILVYPWHRKIFTFGYNRLSRLLIGHKFEDTQVGCKIFKKTLISHVIKYLTINRYSFDVEILSLSQKLGYENYLNIPVYLDFTTSKSHVTNFREIYLMFKDLLVLGFRLHVFEYYNTKNFMHNEFSLIDLINAKKY